MTSKLPSSHQFFAQNDERKTLRPNAKVLKVLSHATSMDEKNFNMRSNKSSQIGSKDLRSVDLSSQKSPISNSTLYGSKAQVRTVDAFLSKNMTSRTSASKLKSQKLKDQNRVGSKKKKVAKNSVPRYVTLPHKKMRSAKVSPITIRMRSTLQNSKLKKQKENL
jgi:hypothetical protein